METKGSAWSHIMMYWARKCVLSQCFISSYSIFFIFESTLCTFLLQYMYRSHFKCMWLSPLILNHRDRSVDRLSLMTVFSFSLSLSLSFCLSLSVSFSLCLSGVPNRTWLCGDDVRYNPGTLYLNMDKNRSDISQCYWSSNRGRAVCFERWRPVDPIWPTVHKVKKGKTK